MDVVAAAAANSERENWLRGEVHSKVCSEANRKTVSLFSFYHSLPHPLHLRDQKHF
jgi:hypothetical protein